MKNIDFWHDPILVNSLNFNFKMVFWILKLLFWKFRKNLRPTVCLRFSNKISYDGLYWGLIWNSTEKRRFFGKMVRKIGFFPNSSIIEAFNQKSNAWGPLSISLLCLKNRVSSRLEQTLRVCWLYYPFRIIKPVGDQVIY